MTDSLLERVGVEEWDPGGGLPVVLQTLYRAPCRAGLPQGLCHQLMRRVNGGAVGGFPPETLLFLGYYYPKELGVQLFEPDGLLFMHQPHGWNLMLSTGERANLFGDDREVDRVLPGGWLVRGFDLLFAPTCTS